MAVEIPVRVIIDAIDNASKNFKSVASQAGNLSDAMKTLGVTGAAVGVAAGLLTRNFVNQAGAMEQNQIAFETMIGSAERATTLLQEMQDFAKQTPFNLPELVEGGKRLLAYNVTAEELIPTMDMLGNITAGVGREKLPQLILAFGQVKAATRLTGMELRQFSEAGVPLLDTLAKQFGVTAKEVSEMVTEGVVGFKDVEKALQTLTGEGGKFHDLMQKQSQSTLGKVSNLEDAWARLSITLGTMLKPATDRVISSMISLTEQIDGFAKKNPELTKNLLTVSGALAAIGAAIVPIAGAIKVLSASITVLRAAWLALAAISTPVITAIGGILAAIGAPVLLTIAAVVAALGLLYVAWTKNWGDIQGKTQQAKDAIGKAVGDMVTWITGIPDKISAVGQRIQAVWNDVATAFGIVIDVARGWDPGAIMDDKTWERFKGFALTLVDIRTRIEEFVAATGSALQALPGQIADGMEQAALRILKFYIEDVPHAWGVAAGTLFKFATETIPMAVAAMGAIITEFVTVQLPAMGEQIAMFFTVTIPAAIQAWIAYMSVAIPAAVESAKAWINDMAESIKQTLIRMKDETLAAIDAWVKQTIASMIRMKDQAFAQAEAMYTGVKDWVNKMIVDTQALLAALPGIVTAKFEEAKTAAWNKAKEIYEGVKVWIDKVVDLFNQIVSAAQRAIDKSREAFSAGFDQGRRQFGGPVSAANSYTVGEAGQETFTPQTAGYITPHGAYAGVGARGGGGPIIQFIINADMIINSPGERRSLAEALYQDLMVVARSHNMTVAEYMGG